MKNVNTALLLAMIVAGCAGQASRDEPPTTKETEAIYALRAEALLAVPVWGLTARLGINSGEESGSGRLDWTVGESSSELSFRGTLGRGAWQLGLNEAGATLRLKDGTVVQNDSVGELIARETGMRIPVEALHWWVRGLASPSTEHVLDLDTSGLAAELSQDGWLIRYEKYMEHNGLMMPQVVVTTRDDYEVKLVVKRWRFPGGLGGA